MQAGGDFDIVTDEAHRWSSLDKATILEHTDSAGIVNEFALLYDLRTSFLLTTSSSSRRPRTSHPRGTGSSSSRALAVSDDNGKMDPAVKESGRLLVSTTYAIFQPSVKAILERYLLKFSKGGKTQVHEDDLGLIEEDTSTICEECIN